MMRPSYGTAMLGALTTEGGAAPKKDAPKQSPALPLAIGVGALALAGVLLATMQKDAPRVRGRSASR